MNENEIDNFIKSLPELLREFIYRSVWEERTSEIAQKYSLNETQTDDLINNVLFVLIGLQKPEEFLPTIITELNISRLLAEQIMEDLEVRVFEYAVKSIEKGSSGSSSKLQVASGENSSEKPVGGMSSRVLDSDTTLISSKLQNPISNENQTINPNDKTEITPSIENDTLEIRPEILPEERPDILPVVERPAPEVAEIESKKLDPQGSTLNPVSQGQTFEQTKTNEKKVLVKPETISATGSSVPRFSAIPIEEEEEVEISKSKFPMSNQTQNLNDKVNVEQKTPEPVPVSESPKRYAVDPYREPIE